MPRLTDEEWEELRAEFETDHSATRTSLGKKYNITVGCISRRARKEGWTRDNTKAAAALDIVRKQKQVSVSEAKNVQAIDNQAKKILRILERHQNEWGRVWKMLRQAVRFGMDGTVVKRDFDLLKCTKITTEIILNAQKGERLAYGIELETPNVQVNTQINNNAGDGINWNSLSDDELRRMEKILEKAVK